MLNSHYVELEKISPIILEILRNGVAVAFVSSCPPLSLCFLIHKQDYVKIVQDDPRRKHSVRHIVL